jgi:hypothetical protein
VKAMSGIEYALPIQEQVSHLVSDLVFTAFSRYPGIGVIQIDCFDDRHFDLPIPYYNLPVYSWKVYWLTRLSRISIGKTKPAAKSHHGTSRRSISAKMSTAEIFTKEVPSQKRISSNKSDLPKK